jgi:hypothetical protein
MGRPKSKDSRRSKAERRRLESALSQRVQPADYILKRRELFSFVTPTKGPDGRVGEIDQDICDPIGQLHAVGLLDGHGIDAQTLRDDGRFWGQYCAVLHKSRAARISPYERRARSQPNLEMTKDDYRFDRMDESLWSAHSSCGFVTYRRKYERDVLFDLIVTPLVGEGEGCWWAEALICKKLWERGKVPPLNRFATQPDKDRLAVAIRGLCLLVDAGLPARKIAA